MAISKLVEFARDGDKSTSGLTLTAGFPRAAKPARQWFNYLFNQITTKVNELATAIDEINDKEIPVLEVYDVGDVYVTTKTYADGVAVKAKRGYGTWVRYAEGRTLVGYSTKTGDPAEYKTMGNEFGANTHTLTEPEMPSHKHTLKHGYDNGSTDNDAGTIATDSATWSGQYIPESTIGSAGGDQPHNNIQPSVVVAYWLRTA